MTVSLAICFSVLRSHDHQLATAGQEGLGPGTGRKAVQEAIGRGTGGKW